MYIVDPSSSAALLSDNCFVGNYYPSSVLNTSIYVPSDTRLERSWWGSSAGPIVSQDTALPATANQDSLYNSSNYTPILTALPVACDRLPVVPTPTQTMTPTATQTTNMSYPIGVGLNVPFITDNRGGCVDSSVNSRPGCAIQAYLETV
jgi:hypothetical protein